MTAEPDHLVLAVEVTDPANLAGMQQIVGGLVERFASRDGLKVELGPRLRSLSTLRFPALADCADPAPGRSDRRRDRRQKYREGMEDQLSALGFLTNVAVFWNTIYTARALEQIRTEGSVGVHTPRLTWPDLSVNKCDTNPGRVPDEVGRTGSSARPGLGSLGRGRAAVAVATAQTPHAARVA